MRLRARRGWIMDDIKAIAKQAKRRLGSDFWRRCKEDVDYTARQAEMNGKNANRVKSHLYERVRSVIRGEEEDEFYLKVKKLLDEHGKFPTRSAGLPTGSTSKRFPTRSGKDTQWSYRQNTLPR